MSGKGHRGRDESHEGRARERVADRTRRRRHSPAESTSPSQRPRRSLRVEVPAAAPVAAPPTTQPSGSDLRHLVQQIQAEGVNVPISVVEVPAHGQGTRSVRHQPPGSGVGRSGVPASAGSSSLATPDAPGGIVEKRTVSMGVTVKPAIKQPPCAGVVTEDTVVAAIPSGGTGQQATKAAADIVVILDSDSSGVQPPVTDLFSAAGPNWPAVEEVAEPTYLVSDHYLQDGLIQAHRVPGCKTVYANPLAYVGLPEGTYYDPKCLDDPQTKTLMENHERAQIPMPFPLDFLQKYENTLSISVSLFNVFIYGRQLFKRYLLNQMNDLTALPLTVEEMQLLTYIACAWHDLRCGVVAPGRYTWFGRGIRWTSQHDSEGNLRPIRFSMRKTSESTDKSPGKPLVHIEDPKKFWFKFQPRIVHEAKGAFHDAPRARDAGYNLSVWSPPENRIYCGVPGCKSQFVSNFNSYQNLGRHWNCTHNNNVRIARCPFADPNLELKCLHESKTIDRLSEYFSPAHRLVHKDQVNYDEVMKKYFRVDPDSGALVWDPKIKDYARDQLSADDKENWLCVVVRRAGEVEQLPKGLSTITGFMILCREPGVIIPLTSAINIADTVRLGVERQSYSTKDIVTVLQPGENFTMMVYTPAGTLLTPEQEARAVRENQPVFYQLFPSKYLHLVIQGPIDPVRHLLRTSSLTSTGRPGEHEQFALVPDTPQGDIQSGEEEEAGGSPSGAPPSSEPSHLQAGYWDAGAQLVAKGPDVKAHKHLLEKAKDLPVQRSSFVPLSTHGAQLRSGEIASQPGFAEHFMTVPLETTPKISGHLKGHRYGRPPAELDLEKEFKVQPRRDRVQEKEDSQPPAPPGFSEVKVRLPSVWTFDPKTKQGQVIDVPQPPGTRAREKAEEARLNDPAYQDPPMVDRVQLARHALDCQGLHDRSGIEYPGSLRALHDKSKREVRTQQTIQPAVRRSRRLQSSVTTRSYVSETQGTRERQPLTGQQKRKYQPSTYEEQAELEDELASSALSSSGRKKGAGGSPSGAHPSPDFRHSEAGPMKKSAKVSPTSHQAAETLLKLQVVRVDPHATLKDPPSESSLPPPGEEAQALPLKQPVSTESVKTEKVKSKKKKRRPSCTSDTRKRSTKRLQRKTPAAGTIKVTPQAVAQQAASQLEETTSTLADLPLDLSQDPRLAAERAKLLRLQEDARKAQENFLAYNRNLQKESRRRDMEAAECRRRQANVIEHERLLQQQLKEVEQGSTKLAQDQADFCTERDRLHAEIAHQRSALGVPQADLKTLIKPVTTAAFNQQELNKLKADRDALAQQLEDSQEQGQSLSTQNSCARQLIELMNTAISMQAPVNPEAAQEIEALKRRIGELIALMPDPSVLLPTGVQVDPLSPRTVSPVDADLLQQSQFAYDTLTSDDKDTPQASTSGMPVKTEQESDTEQEKKKKEDDDDSN